jgi:hypothetical protein
MPMLTASQVHIDQPLTNLTVAYLQSQDNFIADKVFPNVPVDKKTNKYYIYDRENFFRNEVQPRAPRTRSQRVGMSISNATYTCDVRSLSTDFDFETLANADTALDIRRGASEMLTHNLLIDREKRFMSTFFGTSIWTTEYTGVANADNDTAAEVTQWDDYTNSTPIVDVTTARRAMQVASGGFKPNKMVVTRDVHDTLVNHPDVLARINGGATVTNTALVTQAKLAEIFEVAEYYIVDAIENTAKEGLAESLAFVATKKAALYYAPQSAGLMVPSAGYNFTWNELDNASGYGIDIRSYTGDFLRVEGVAELLEANMAYDQKVVGADLGVFFNTILS